MRFDTKIAILVRNDLSTWQKLNMTAFLVSGIAATTEAIGLPYEDASGRRYLPMFGQPVLVFAATEAELQIAYARAVARELSLAIFTNDLFSTGHDEANRAAVQTVVSDQLSLAELALCADRKAVDAVVKGISLHS